MSKLFDTLKRLEAQEKSRDHSIESLGKNLGECSSKREDFPYVKKLILPLAILVASIGAGYVVSYLVSEHLFLRTHGQPVQSAKPHKLPKSVSIQAGHDNAQPNSLPPKKKIRQDDPDVLKKVSPQNEQPKVIEKTELELRKLLEDVKKVSAPKNAEQKVIEKSQKVTSTEETPLKVTIMDPYSSQKTLRLIHLAEELRIKGDIEGAVNIFKQLWHETFDPLVANNLGALLILMGKYSEAKDVLETALKISPQDEDLKYNYLLIRQLESRLNEGGK